MAAPSLTRSSCFGAATTLTRVFATPAPSKAFFTTTSAPLKQLRNAHEPANTITSRIASSRQVLAPKPHTARHASTTTSNNATTAEPTDVLTWNRFFDLRRKRRFLNLGASAITSLATISFAAPIIANQDIDTWGAQVSGMDPFVVLGVTTFTVAIGGWMCGPTIGTSAFKIWAGRRGWNAAIAQVG